MKKNNSLEEVHNSIDTGAKTSVFKRILAFFGPAYMVSVGYMDPGNWATDLAGGSRFGYTLLWVLLMSNLMALLLQSLSARLGIVRQRDLAQASRDTYSRPVNFILYFLAEIAIAACDLAEVLGMAIGLELLFDIPLLWGVSITLLDTFLLLFLMNKGIKKMEAFIISLIAIIGLSFIIEIFLAEPEMSEMAKGLIPSIPGGEALYIAIGIIGATVMPHNLYLHSSLVQTRKFDRTKKGIKQAIKYNFWDSVIALNLAFFVNAAILILAAATFYRNGMFEIAEIQDAHKLLQPLLGTKWAAILFALALIAAGQSSTITGTLAGQIVMEGYLNLRIQPWVRRILTRLVAIVPAFLAIYYFGERSTGELLILSQVILSLQLGFAIIPLIHFVSNKQKMQGFEISLPTKIVSWLVTLVIVSLNIKLVYDEIHSWLMSSENPVYIWVFVIPLAVFFLFLLVYITIKPVLEKARGQAKLVPHIDKIIVSENNRSITYANIAIALDFSEIDKKSLESAFQLGGKEAKYVLIHIVETVGAFVYGDKAHDFETMSDARYLDEYKKKMEAFGYKVEVRLGFGNPKTGIPEVVNGADFDILIMGAHGHNWVKDLLFGTTVGAVRHKINIPVLITV
ncbi:Nramp family divalent metal transporter [Flavobacterium sp. NRK F10]|uniref:Divalent metal cation transporter MntH n=1 Tax=Flavobacterium sediminis TaxID=2201181 RepID=A0A2U8QUD0_9FLAO|nr:MULTISPECIES: Nramp family divalent metal transporter [Flavobacterium]AWM13486.1 iron/manganese transporter [Flavobacterium sediminis]MCO6174876.1 Nramp family divalent metal transporter [Flavobacterium sp. NRK F10]